MPRIEGVSIAVPKPFWTQPRVGAVTATDERRRHGACPKVGEVHRCAIDGLMRRSDSDCVEAHRR